MDGKAEQIYGEERQRQWFSVQSCIPKFEATVGAEHIWSQEAVVSFGSLTQMPGPKGLGHLLLLSQAISRELGERGAARMLTGIHTGSQCLHGEDLAMKPSVRPYCLHRNFFLLTLFVALQMSAFFKHINCLSAEKCWECVSMHLKHFFYTTQCLKINAKTILQDW